MESLEFSAWYFDGLTSAPLAVKLRFHPQQKLLYFQVQDASEQQWQFTDIELQDAPGLVELRNRSDRSAFIRIDTTKEQRNQIHITVAKNNFYFQFRQLSLFKVILVACLVFFGLLAAYLWVLPPLAERAVLLLPITVDDQIGDTFYASFVEHSDIDQKRTKALNAFADELELYNKRPLHFNVVKSSEVNAFAMPNGEIVVYTGLLDQLDNTAQLVALLGHEVSHVNERHSMRLLSRNLAGYLVLSLVIGDVSGFTAVLADNAQQLQMLSYSRKHEEEADHLGLKILIKNKQNPTGMLELFAKLKGSSQINVPELLSSHPLPTSRIQALNKKLVTLHYRVEPNDKLETYFSQLKR
jgi:Zn-dependent protease with chaperone function